jgi:hypothetical protein
MNDSFNKLFSAEEYIARETLQEMEVALASRRNCTYTKRSEAEKFDVFGMMQRIWSCTTCADSNNGIAIGVCEPCALRCHADHELVDVGDRRQFRCDCPTEDCPIPCSANPSVSSAPGVEIQTANLKHSSNRPLNKYGHNFQDKFCRCNRPYDSSRDTMHQCVSCDDWFHAIDTPMHTPGMVSPMISFDSFLCGNCTESQAFLTRFLKFIPDVCSKLLPPPSPVPPPIGADPATIKPSSLKTPKKEPAGSVLSAPASPSAVAAAPGSRLQPWVVCLTCTKGADEGEGICMACSKVCHKNHVLSKPRITEFECDCEALCKKNNEHSACLLVSTPSSSLPASVIEEMDAIWCAAKVSSEHQTNEVAGCQSVKDAGLFLDCDDDLLKLLCRCDACMKHYAAKGVINWFFEQPADDPEMEQAELLQSIVEKIGSAVESQVSAVPSAAATSIDLKDASSAKEDPASGGILPDQAAKIGHIASSLRETGFKTSYEEGMAQLASLPLQEQLDAIHHYDSLRSGVMEWLSSKFGDGSGGVVTEEDVREFVAKLKNGHKRQKTEQ